MHCGWPTPFTPARKWPPPPPEPPEEVIEAANGSPKLLRFGFGTFRSGGPSSEASIGSLGAGFGWASGGVNCVILNFGALPFVAGKTSRSPPPPPPPALLAPAGSLDT